MNETCQSQTVSWRQALPTAGRVADGVAAAGRFLRRRPRWLAAVAVIVVTCSALWWNDYHSAENRALRRVQELGGYGGVSRISPAMFQGLRGTPLEPLLRLFSTKRAAAGLVVEGKPATDADIAEFVAALPTIEQIDVSSTLIGDEALAEIGKLPALFLVAARHTKVSDAGVKSLAGRSGLCIVDLAGTHITDAALADLATLPRLCRLSVAGTSVTDAGLAQLQGPTLLMLDVTDTQVTDAGVASFQAANPRCSIVR